MKKAFCALLIGLSAIYATSLKANSLEEFFICKDGQGKAVARVYVNPAIFCGNEVVNPATLLWDRESSSNLFNGELLRWSDGKGESFTFRKSREGHEFEVSMTLPYGLGKGYLASVIDGEVESKQELNCLTKQLHVDCK